MPFTIFVVFPSGRAASNDLYTYIGEYQKMLRILYHRNHRFVNFGVCVHLQGYISFRCSDIGGVMYRPVS